jgi:hypothetical protein
LVTICRRIGQLISLPPSEKLSSTV